MSGPRPRRRRPEYLGLASLLSSASAQSIAQDEQLLALLVGEGVHATGCADLCRGGRRVPPGGAPVSGPVAGALPVPVGSASASSAYLRTARLGTHVSSAISPIERAMTAVKPRTKLAGAAGLSRFPTTTGSGAGCRVPRPCLGSARRRPAAGRPRRERGQPRRPRRARRDDRRAAGVPRRRQVLDRAAAVRHPRRGRPARPGARRRGVVGRPSHGSLGARFRARCPRPYEEDKRRQRPLI